jgi:hypothetical protein
MIQSMKRTLLLFGFCTCFGALTLSAQDNDFLVTVKGDTVKGKLRILATDYDRQVQVTTVARKKSNYSILQIRKFSLDGEQYEPVKLGQAYVFMKLVKEGYLSLYAFQMERQMTYEGRYLRKRDGQGIEVPNLGFKKNMAKFMEECPSITNKISAGDLGRSDLNTIIDEYNSCIATNTLSVAKSPTLTQPAVANESASQWVMLEEKVKASNLSTKNDALEMIADIRNKLSRGEKIPKFLSEGLKTSLAGDQQLLDMLTLALSNN